MKRLPAIELLRLLLMYGILLLHVITKCGYCNRGLDNILSPCVVGFVFISGYFGIKFSWRKIARLVLLAIFCSSLMGFVGFITNVDKQPLYMWIVDARGYWFLWTYIALMMFSPLINVSVEYYKGDVKGALRVLAPVLFCVYIWSYAKSVPVISDYVPNVVGFGPLSLISLVGAYLCARFYKVVFEPALVKCDWLMKYYMRLIVPVALLLSMACSYFGLYHHNFICSVIVALCLFELVRRLPINGVIGCILSFLAPSAFSIYLLHCTTTGMYALRQSMVIAIEDYQASVYAAYIIVSIVWFLIYLAADVVRRFVIHKACLRKV